MMILNILNDVFGDVCIIGFVILFIIILLGIAGIIPGIKNKAIMIIFAIIIFIGLILWMFIL